MTTKPVSGPRCAALVGTYTSGKTTLMEALLHHAGAIGRKGTVREGNTVGDSSVEARERQMSVELNVARCDYLGEPWTLLDCPGSIELAQESHNALMGADVAVVVADPEESRALTLAPLFRFLADHDIPHMLFINKMDKATSRVRDVLAALQSVSSKPLVLRQVPIREGDQISGFVDLVSERAYKYIENSTSDLVQMPDDVKDRESEARQEMLESLADFDDTLLEQLLEDIVPPSDEIYGQLTKDLQSDLIVPVLLGAAEPGNGITRLWKALRHETPEAAQTAERLGIPLGGPGGGSGGGPGGGQASGEGFTATVVKTFYQAHTGKLSLARIWDGTLAEGNTIAGERPSGLFRMMGGHSEKLGQAGAGDVVGLGRMEELQIGDLLTAKGRGTDSGMIWPEPLKPVYAMAVTPVNRQDDVKLTSGIGRLIEEDPSLALEHNPDTHQMLLWGQGEIHLRVAAERLKSKSHVEVTLSPPLTAYKETIRKGIKQHSRFKRQSGGHGQFGDVHVEIKPLPRGSGFEFSDSVVGGSVPKQYIPSVETGVKEYLDSGPLGFPVVDVAVNLYDGQYHSVDSSDQAFKTAGRLAMSEGMPQCDPVLLEPIFLVKISVPSDFTSRVHGLISGRRGQILGFDGRQGWPGWDVVQAHMPQSEIHDLIVELRSLTLGVGTYEFAFDHLQELIGKLADKVISARQSEQAAH